MDASHEGEFLDIINADAPIHSTTFLSLNELKILNLSTNYTAPSFVYNLILSK